MEVSEALDDTGLSGKMRSTIWEWSQNLRRFKNKDKTGNTSEQHEKKKYIFFQNKGKFDTQAPQFGAQKNKINSGNQFEAILVGGTMVWKWRGNLRGRTTKPYL